MNRQTIMELAEQAGGEFVGRGIMTELCTYSYSLEFESLERFAMLVRDHALEEAITGMYDATDSLHSEEHFIYKEIWLFVKECGNA